MSTSFFLKFFFNFSYFGFLITKVHKKFIFIFQKTKKNMPQFYICYLVGLFLFVFSFNFFSVGPYTFPLTTQLRLILCISLMSWLPITFFLVRKNFKGFLYHLVPEGRPIALVPILVIIEFVRRIIRPLTLTIRLVANTLAGHVLIELYCSLGWKSLLLFRFYPLLSLVEIIVALIQAYVFIIISLLYLSEIA